MPCEDTVRTLSTNQEAALTRHGIGWHLDRGLSASKLSPRLNSDTCWLLSGSQLMSHFLQTTFFPFILIHTLGHTRPFPWLLQQDFWVKKLIAVPRDSYTCHVFQRTLPAHFKILSLGRLLAKQWNGALFPLCCTFVWRFHARNLVCPQCEEEFPRMPSCNAFHFMCSNSTMVPSLVLGLDTQWTPINLHLLGSRPLVGPGQW